MRWCCWAMASQRMTTPGLPIRSRMRSCAACAPILLLLSNSSRRERELRCWTVELQRDYRVNGSRIAGESDVNSCNCLTASCLAASEGGALQNLGCDGWQSELAPGQVENVQVDG